MIFIFFGVISDDETDLINEIFTETNVKMYNISFNILRNKSDAEEAVSETFIKIINNIEKISSLSCHEIEPYCVVILKNETMNILRQGKKTIQEEDLDILEHDNKHYSVEENFLENVEIERLLSCVNKLPEIDRNFIHLRYVNEMRYREIAVLLNITEEAARKRSQRILSKLRLHYEEGESSVKNN